MIYILMLLVLGLLIMVHEAGHFIAARWMKVPVKRFSIGFGPSLWKTRKGGVDYRIGVVPLGGYVMLDLADETSYLGLPLKKRMVFTLGGPAANIIFAVPLYAVLAVTTHGLSIQSLFVSPVSNVLLMLGAIFNALVHIFEQPETLNGVVGLVVEGGRYINWDFLRTLSLAAGLSINLAVFNMVPLPPLDGGKLVLDVLHRLFPPLNKAYLPTVLGGWLLLMLLMVYTVIKDVGRYWA